MADQYPLYTLLTFDKFQKGTPCVWAIMQEWKDEYVATFLHLVKCKVDKYRRDNNDPKPWTPSCFIVDCASEERNAIGWVFPHSHYQLCIWHVRKAWSKYLISKVTCPFAKAQINRDLDAMMYARDTGKDIVLSIAFALLSMYMTFTATASFSHVDLNLYRTIQPQAKCFCHGNSGIVQCRSKSRFCRFYGTMGLQGRDQGICRVL